ncbi:pimeloyl-ACP methyl ester carboxylesterase [Kibdelosporangium banguiense]|uniref:Pimeloyl-ACP methyl ester carboxylesterase n=1 Tax=Kibdelosporangium banguiense TaxID=1365924 RepID=A0ABS4TLE4_9PSEU|nr:alpha/beta hydrolase [Kibdelosporangium banguiense]MBP2325243.1 pimeloyl-ACP methyl ester carboxylesterase [Kibdelosporangium banguiense]
MWDEEQFANKGAGPMATYVLIPGAGGQASHWRFVAPELRKRGHDVVAVDLPADDDEAGFDEYADAIVEAVGDRRDLILVAQSLAGFSAPIACTRIKADLLVMVAAMTPKPGESAGEWWTATGQDQAERELKESFGVPGDSPFDPLFTFLHDVPAGVLAEVLAEGEIVQSGTPFAKPWPLRAWPDVPTRFLLCQDDRMFPAAFQRRIVQERLGFTPDEMPGGHLPAFSRPLDLVERLEAYRLSA